MNNFKNQLNKILVQAYHNILLMEETKRKNTKTTTSFRERNAIEYLYDGKGEGKKISEIAEYLKISRPSATSIIKKLEKLGYLIRHKDKDDERSTIIYLTNKGRMVARIQESYRDKVISELCDEFNDEEKQVLYRGFCKLNEVLEVNTGIMIEEELKNKKKEKVT